MPDGGLQERTTRLAARVDALAAALHECGAAEDAAARLLGHASAAVLQALTLELLLAAPQSAPVAEPAVETQPLPLAA
jgi:hypothetical protein